MRHVIEFEQLSRHFGRTEAVRDLTFGVPQGSIYAFLGPNGAGKTTTIKVLMNLLDPSGGRAAVFGRDSIQLQPADLARIGYVSENQVLPEWMTPEQLLAFCKPFYPTWDDGLCGRLLRMFDLPPHRKIRTFSRGMKMKVAMVAASACARRALQRTGPARARRDHRRHARVERRRGVDHFRLLARSVRDREPGRPCRVHPRGASRPVRGIGFASGTLSRD